MKYLIVCGHSYADKNKLQTELKRVFRVCDRDIWDSEADVQQFVKDVAEKASALFPRCKPISLRLYKTENDLRISGGLGMEVTFYAFDDSMSEKEVSDE